jgi:amino acid transporter
MEGKKPHHHLLRKDVLGTYDAVAQSIALLAVLLGVALSSSSVAGAAGAAAPLVYLLAGLGCLCLTYIFIRFARLVASAGGIYAYIVRGLGPIAGFLGGWLYAGAWALGMSFILGITINYLLPILGIFHINVDWIVLYVVLAVLLFLSALFDIRISTRSQLVLEAVGILSVLILVALILRKGGVSGLSLTPFSPAALPSGISGLFFAMIFGFIAFIGFEGAIVLGEETVNPQRAIPRALLIAVVVGIIFYVLVAYSFSIGYGVTHVVPASAHDKALNWANDQVPLHTMGSLYGGPVLATIIDLIVVLSGLMSALGNLNLTARMLYAMGRDRGLPSIFGRTHSRYKSPWVALVFGALVTLLLGSTLGLILGPFVFPYFVIAIGAEGVLLGYILVAISGIVFFWRSESRSKNPLVRILDVILPLIAIFLCGAAIFSSVSSAPQPPFNLAPYIVAAWLALGVIVVGWLWISKRELVSAFGKLLTGSPSVTDAEGA